MVKFSFTYSKQKKQPFFAKNSAEKHQILKCRGDVSLPLPTPMAASKKCKIGRYRIQ